LSEMEIVFDPKWEAACAGLAMGEEHEAWPDGEWIRYARRLTGIKDLFVYRHKRANSWVLAKWIYPPTSTDSPVALELEAMPLPPDMPESGRLVGDNLRLRCSPVDEMVQNIKSKMRDAASERRAMQDEEEMSRKTAAKYMRSKGLDKAAYDLENGYTAWTAPSKCGSQYHQTVSEINALTKVV
jgi:hypothetical protein